MKLTSYFIFLSLFFNSILFAKDSIQKVEYILSSKILNNGTKKIELDLNQDKKVDQIETYKDNKLITIERFSTIDRKINEWITYSPYVSSKVPIEVFKLSNNKNGKINRIKKVFREPENNFLIITTEVDSNNDGKFNKKWTTTTKLNEEKEEITCNENLDIDNLEIFKLTNEIKSINQSLNQKYYVTDLGYKIHESCLTTWGTDTFPTLVKKAMNKGFLCLANLAKDNAKNAPKFPNGAAENLNNLNYILQNSGVTIICNQTDYNWSGVAAHASTSPTEIIKESGIEHPFISINSSYPKLSLKPTPDESTAITRTLFHEQLHNLGIRHGEDIEFPYACETCCIDENEGLKTKDACKICAGSYTGPTDKNYIIDIIAWGKSSEQSKKSAKSIIKFQKEFPKDRFGLFAYAAASGDINSPVGIEMGKILKKKFSPLSTQEQIFIKNSEKYSDKPNFSKTADYSKKIAEAHIALYYEQDTNKALDLLENNKELKNIIAFVKISQSDDSSIYNNIKNQVFDLLVDIWMQGYPDSNKPENLRAQKVLKDAGFLKL